MQCLSLTSNGGIVWLISQDDGTENTMQTSLHHSRLCYANNNMQHVFVKARIGSV